jgi:hypothetical protein
MLFVGGNSCVPEAPHPPPLQRAGEDQRRAALPAQNPHSGGFGAGFSGSAVHPPVVYRGEGDITFSRRAEVCLRGSKFVHILPAWIAVFLTLGRLCLLCCNTHAASLPPLLPHSTVCHVWLQLPLPIILEQLLRDAVGRCHVQPT